MVITTLSTDSFLWLAEQFEKYGVDFKMTDVNPSGRGFHLSFSGEPLQGAGEYVARANRLLSISRSSLPILQDLVAKAGQESGVIFRGEMSDVERYANQVSRSPNGNWVSAARGGADPINRFQIMCKMVSEWQSQATHDLQVVAADPQLKIQEVARRMNPWTTTAGGGAVGIAGSIQAMSVFLGADLGVIAAGGAGTVAVAGGFVAAAGAAGYGMGTLYNLAASLGISTVAEHVFDRSDIDCFGDVAFEMSPNFFAKHLGGYGGYTINTPTPRPIEGRQIEGQ